LRCSLHNTNTSTRLSNASSSTYSFIMAPRFIEPRSPEQVNTLGDKRVRNVEGFFLPGEHILRGPSSSHKRTSGVSILSSHPPSRQSLLLNLFEICSRKTYLTIRHHQVMEPRYSFRGVVCRNTSKVLRILLYQHVATNRHLCLEGCLAAALRAFVIGSGSFSPSDFITIIHDSEPSTTATVKFY
jgi:hypothetical protein